MRNTRQRERQIEREREVFQTLLEEESTHLVARMDLDEVAELGLLVALELAHVVTHANLNDPSQRSICRICEEGLEEARTSPTCGPRGHGRRTTCR